ncbi:hypothetical protein GAYE_SCF39G5349 [Galdieria yellowstonensis]|uniref:Uncharacterized protein n=1 Tax=Galdieria yellowstonensis TaxID=3028027 RepID=A0AAV9IJ21_9RHOD|nr:hypothetical protein GAYE_SCF39G5349 [Galdieria yellowstonensis]
MFSATANKQADPIPLGFSDSRQTEQTEPQTLVEDNKSSDSTGTVVPDQTEPSPKTSELGSAPNEYENFGAEPGMGNGEMTVGVENVPQQNAQVAPQNRDMGAVSASDTEYSLEEKVTTNICI